MYQVITILSTLHLIQNEAAYAERALIAPWTVQEDTHLPDIDYSASDIDYFHNKMQGTSNQADQSLNGNRDFQLQVSELLKRNHLHLPTLNNLIVSKRSIRVRFRNPESSLQDVAKHPDIVKQLLGRRRLRRCFGSVFAFRYTLTPCRKAGISRGNISTPSTRARAASLMLKWWIPTLGMVS